jgi:hypothetical protein
MAASTNKTWRLAPGVNGSWGTAGNWSNDDGTQSTVIPSAAAVVTIFGSGNITIAGQTCNSLIINGGTTFIGTGLTVSNDVTINGVTLNHNGTGSLAVGRNFTNSGQFNQNQTTTGVLTFNGAQAATVELGSHTVRAITIAKTVNNINNAITLNGLDGVIRCELTNSTASVFTFTSGYLINYAYIYTRTLVNSSSTARSWDQREEVVITLGVAGTGVSASQTTCTYVNRNWIRLLTTNTSGTITATFGAGPPSTCPNVVLDSYSIYTISGSLWIFYPNAGTQTSTNTITVFKGVNGYGTLGPWTSVTINLVSSAQNEECYVDCLARFGTITCPGSWVSGTTYTGILSYINFYYVTCNTLNLNGIQATYLMNGGTIYTTISYSSTSGSSGSILNLYNGTTNNFTLSTNVNNTTNVNGESFSVTGITTFNTGILKLFSNFNTVSFTSTGTLARNFDWTSGYRIQTSGAGTISLTLSTNSSITYTGDNPAIGGFYHGGTGTATGNASTWTATPRMKTWAASSCTWTTWYTNDLEIVDGCQIGSASTINFTGNFTGSTSLNMTGLNVTQLTGGSTNILVNYSGTSIGTFTGSSSSTADQFIYKLNATNITLNYTGTYVYIGSTNNDGVVSIGTNGTVTLGGSSAYYINNLRGYNLTLSNTGTYYCYYYEHNYFTNPPTAGTVTHTAGTLILKNNTDAFSMTTWAFTSTTGTRGITFEDQGYIVTKNTGILNVNYTSLTSVCPETDTCGFYHNSTGAWTIGPAAPATPAAAFNIMWDQRCTVNASYVKNIGNWYPRGDGYRIGGGLLSNGSAITLSVSGNILFTGNGFADNVIQNDTNWQYLNLTYWFADAARTCRYLVGYSEFGVGGVFRAFGTLTLTTAFTGTLALDSILAVTTVLHQGGTLDIRSQLQVTNAYTSTDGTVNKYIIDTSDRIPPSDFNNYHTIYITATSGTPWNFAYTNLLTSDPSRIWIYVRGGTVSHGATARRTDYQPSFDLLENVSAYTLTPSTAFQIGGLKINNYTVPNNSVWSINGPYFLVFNDGITAPANFTLNILGAGTGSSGSCEMNIGPNSFVWPQVNISGNAFINSDDFKFRNININGGTTTLRSTLTVTVTETLGSSLWGGGTLNISGSTWVFTGATAINYDFLNIGFSMISDSTGTARFDGLNGTNLGDQSAGFYTNFGGKIVNNIAYNTGTGVGTLFLTAGYATNVTIPTASQIDFNYTTSSINFYVDRPDAGSYGFPIKGSTFNVGTSSAGYRYIRSRSGNWSNWGIYNTESSSVVSGNYLNIADCTAKGGGGWYAGSNSINGGGTAGWIFSSPATFSLSRSAATVNEGGSVTITLTSNVPNNTLIPYTITGITSADISGASLTGNFTVNSGTASVVLNISNDFATEGNETLTLSLNNGAASISVTIIDTSLLPTYSLARSAATVTEGDSFTITLTTTNLPNGSTVPYTITGVSSSDINNASLTGNFTISGNSASLVVNTTWDYVTEGTETFTLTINPTYGTGSSISVAINNLLRPTYALSATPNSLNEGGNFTITLTTTDVANNTALPYTITGVSSADISGASLTGNFTVVSNTASAIFTTTQDYVTEGDETFVLTLNTIGTNVSVLLIDYTKTRTYSLTSNVTTTVTEGGSFNITLTTTNVFDGTLVPYTITGVSSADINSASLTGNFTINSNIGSQSFTTTIDGIVEGTETFTLTLGSPASGSINVSIVDPSAGGGNGFLLFH